MWLEVLFILGVTVLHNILMFLFLFYLPTPKILQKVFVFNVLCHCLCMSKSLLFYCYISVLLPLSWFVFTLLICARVSLVN